MLPTGAAADPDRAQHRDGAGQIQDDAHLQKEAALQVRGNGLLEQHRPLPLLLRHHHRTSSHTQNILLFAFSSHQIVTLFPKLYESGKDILLGNKEIIDVVTSAANSVIDSVGKTDIMDVVTNAANSVMESVVNATTVAGELAFNQTAQ